MKVDGVAVAAGEFGTILRSKDGGATWEPKVLDWASYRDDGYEPHIYSVDVQDNGRIVLGAEFAYVLVSEDGGETFTLTNKGEKSIFAMHLLPNGTGYAAGQEGLVMKTTDNGSTWTALNSGSNANLFGLWASAQGEIVATGMRALLRSSDGGRSVCSRSGKATFSNTVRSVSRAPIARSVACASILCELARYSWLSQGWSLPCQT